MILTSGQCAKEPNIQQRIDDQLAKVQIVKSAFHVPCDPYLVAWRRLLSEQECIIANQGTLAKNLEARAMKRREQEDEDDSMAADAKRDVEQVETEKVQLEQWLAEYEATGEPPQYLDHAEPVSREKALADDKRTSRKRPRLIGRLSSPTCKTIFGKSNHA